MVPNRSKVIAVVGIAGLFMFGNANDLSAATYHVSGSGFDSDNGSLETPWRTLQHTANQLQPGDQALVEDGIYEGFSTVRSGSATQPIIFKATGDNVVIRIEDPRTADGIDVEGHDYIHIIGFKIRGASRAGIRIVEARGNLIQGCIIGPNQKWAIFTGFTPDIQIIDNACFASVEQHGIYVSNSHTNEDRPIIRGNHCYGNGKNGIQLNGDCYAGGDGIISGALIESNLVHDNNWKGLSLISVQGSVIQNNIVFNNGQAGIGAGGIHLADEPGCSKPSVANLVVNNTVVEPQIAAMRFTDRTADNTVFNNLTVASKVERTIVDEDGPNLIDKESNLRLASTEGLFVDANGNDYELSANSGAIDAGVPSYNGKEAPDRDYANDPRPSGEGHDVGADEVIAQSGALTAPLTTGLVRAMIASPLQGSSPAVSSSADILATHPRILYRPQDVAAVKANAAIPTPEWTRFITWMDDAGAYSKPGAVEFILAYLVTDDESYLQRAEQNADAVAADMSAERSDSYLQISHYVRHVAIAYDFLYDRLSAAKRTTYINYMNQVMDELWNSSDNPTNTWNGWSTESPGNNYYYSFMMATIYAGVALHNENPSPPTLPFDGTGYTSILDFAYAKINGQMLPYLTSYGKGGGWHEGINYRLGSWMHMFEAFLVLRNAGGPDLFKDIAFPAETVYFNTYITQPGNARLYPGGDLAREASMPLSGYDLTTYQLLAEGLDGTIEGQYAQYWTENLGIKPFKASYGLDALLQRDRPSRGYIELPNGYFAEGLGFVNSRSNWTSDAVAVSFISTDRILGHQHFDQNSFVIWKHDWQAPDVNVYSKSGLIQATDAHNSIIVDGWGQRMSAGTGEVTKYELTTDYSYAVGNASDAYYGGQFGRKDKGDPPLLTHFERELVHVFPDIIIVFDRITPVSAGSDIKYLIHSKVNPIVQGNLITASLGLGKMFHKTLLPAGAGFNTVGENHGPSGALSSYRVEISSPPVANHLFLNVINATPESASLMRDTELLLVETDNMVGAKVDLGAEEGIFLFSKDPTGNAPSSVIYEVGFATPTDHHLMDLKPSTEYRVDTVRAGETIRVMVSEGPGKLTSDQGVLVFTTGAHIELAGSPPKP